MGGAPDLASLARDLVRVHDAVLSGARPPVRPRPVVARSWSRMMKMGLDPDSGRRSLPLSPAQVDERRRSSRLSLVIDELQAVLTSAADASQYLVVVADADGVILWRKGSARVRHQADALGFADGATWTESQVGTNAIGTVLAEAAPVQLFSAEHFESAQIPWYCTAAPIHDPCDGSMLGVVDVSGPALTLHPAIAALVGTAVQLAEARLWRRHEERIAALRRSVEPLIGSGSGPLLVVDDFGWVAAHHGVAGRDRIEVPRAGRAVAVPGLGLCVPERLRDGWLMRPQSAAIQLSARLEIVDSGGILIMTGSESGWRVDLGRRHTQILRVLAAAGGAGVTSAQLSQALFGDESHQVSARAEVSRLRKVIGALVATQPYRLADGVRLEVSG